MCQDTLRTQHTPCQYPDCRRKVWRDPDGSYSSYCGTIHRDTIKQLNGGADSVRLCQTCQARPVYIENRRLHDFCGTRCRDAFREGVENPASRRASLTPEHPICQLELCNKPTFKGSDGLPGAYCTNTHRIKAMQIGMAEACILCSRWPTATINDRLSDFCSKRCSQSVLDSAPLILNVSPRTEAFKEVSMQFRTQWKHPNVRCPTVVKIWKIFCDKDHNDGFSRYRLTVERMRNIPGGNSRRQWHGTARVCNIGDGDNECALCRSRACSLCGIIRTSYLKVRAGEAQNFLRFGKGIYTTGTSSKAHSYIKQLSRSKYNAMLLNDVVVGKGIRLTAPQTTLTKPPPGYDSVIGKPGNSLNYDELVVYQDEAIRPLFLVIYE